MLHFINFQSRFNDIQLYPRLWIHSGKLDNHIHNKNLVGLVQLLTADTFLDPLSQWPSHLISKLH